MVVDLFFAITSWLVAMQYNHRRDAFAVFMTLGGSLCCALNLSAVLRQVLHG